MDVFIRRRQTTPACNTTGSSRRRIGVFLVMSKIILTVGFVAVLLGKTAFAVTVAADQASNATYATEAGGAWKGLLPSVSENPPGTDNGGFGFLPWNFAGGFHDSTVSPYGRLNHFIDGVDFAHSSSNNLGSSAFGLTNANVALSGFTSSATRVFSQPLTVGDTFSVQFDNPILAPLTINDQPGYIIRLNSGGGPKIDSNPNVVERLAFFAVYGFDQGSWHLSDAGGSIDTGLASDATTSGAVFRVRLQSAESYLLEILPIAGGAPLYSATGNLASTGMGNIDTLEILIYGNGSGNGLTGAAGLPTGQREFFFDKLSLNAGLLTGDFNRDGTVNGSDYVLWRATLNRSVANGTGADGNSDGVVNQPDYNVWRQHFGNSGASAGSGTNDVLVAVPEPNHPGLLWFAAVIAIIFRCRCQCNRLP
jgi:hypothetical protein